MIDETLLDAEDRMEKAVDAARGEFGNIRSGRANAAMFTSILVDYYGAPTPLQQLATIAIPEARTVLITPFDRSATASIDKVRRKAKEALDRIKRDGEAGEDDVKRAEDRLDKLAKRYVDQVDKLLDAKEKELLEV